VKELKLGPYRFRNVPTYIFEDDFNVTSYPYLGGLIGNDILRRFNTIFNYQKRDIYLIPNTHYREPFDYSYSGIELYFTDGQTVIGNVSEGSPAEQGGVKVGDIVVAINNNFTQNFNQYKTTLQSSNERVKLILRRKDELVQITFKVKSIL
jgi:predicted metalloprotease with PDZ domain